MASMTRTSITTASITINIKTLDSSDFKVNVAQDSSIPDLKSKIAGRTGFENHRQRLIFQGRVLRNDKNMSSYEIADGHTVHLVVRPADIPNTTPSHVSPPPRPAATAALPRRRSEIIMGARITVAERGMVPPELRNLFSNLFSVVGLRPQMAHANQAPSRAPRVPTEPAPQAVNTHSLPSRSERILQALNHDGRRQERLLRQHRLLSRTQRLLRDATSIMRRCEQSCGIRGRSNSVTETDLLATAVPAASVSIPAPTSTTANASSGTVPSNIPTTATSAAAAAMSTETALPVAVTRPPPNPRSLEDISQLLVQMQELVSRTQAPMQRVAGIVDGYRRMGTFPQEGPSMANHLGEALKSIGKLCVRTAYHLRYIMTDEPPPIMRNRARSNSTQSSTRSRTGRCKRPNADISSSSSAQATSSASAESTKRKKTSATSRRKKTQKKTKRKRPRLSQTRVAGSGSNANSAPAPPVFEPRPLTEPARSSSTASPAGTNRPFRLLHAAASMLAQRPPANAAPTPPAASSRPASSTFVPPFGRRVIMQVAPMNFGVTPLAALPVQLRRVLQHASVAAQSRAESASISTSSSSTSSSQSTQPN